MKLDIVWSEKEYQKFIKFLRAFEDIEYKKFISKINKDHTSKYIGVRTPILRKIAKAISKADYMGFIKYNGHKFYEEKIIHGFIIDCAPLTHEDMVKMLKEFVSSISDWPLVDMIAAKFNQVNTNKDKALRDISKFSESHSPWEVRLGLILILNSYIEGKYIKKILSICESVGADSQYCGEDDYEIKVPYYVSMANAWLMSECYVKFPEVVSTIFSSRIVDPWTHKKALKKIRDSCRVDAPCKNFSRDLRVEFKKM
ncbi:MAG: DNA alkylation repair protein [Oscillospiraceae bacterium]|jgi:3-methyladenine DNA glycosylase AlkD|nr:DNA alkylation repair protein [Oscillospiraceae bacterium]